MGPRGNPEGLLKGHEILADALGELVNPPACPQGNAQQGSHLHSMRLLKPANLLDVVHEVTAVHVFHHEVQAVLEEDSKWPVSTGISQVPSGQQGIAGRRDQTPESHQLHRPALCSPWGVGGLGGEGFCVTVSMQVSTGGTRAFFLISHSKFMFICIDKDT